MSGVKDNPRSVMVIYGLVAAGLIRFSRQWAALLLLEARRGTSVVGLDERKPVIIYGAGTVGIQLLRALNDTGSTIPSPSSTTSPRSPARWCTA